MNKGVYIFIGQSGSGKGTQVDLLKKKIQSLDPEASMFDLETGKIFRELIKSPTYTGKLTKQMIDQGKLPPSFLGVHAWSHSIIEKYNGNQHVFIDGTPRICDEVPALCSTFDFFDWHPHVINIDVSDEWSYDRLKARGREDDKDENDVWGRIQWFHESVIPAIELLKQSPRVVYHSVSGEQTIECVHRDICEELGLE
ncbi:MAG: nucleoside monophosphate kinase [Candidatus Pacebacteria bacterium]|nr:nucleoside monophosphate kinase [Candidatus Paceibacterota bacterium]